MRGSILFLTEAGEGIGFGHLMRMQAIQKEAVKQQFRTLLGLYFIGNRESIPPIIDEKIINWISKIEDICVLGEQYQVVLVDSYQASFEVYNKLKEYFSRLIILDDYCRLNYPADLIINPNLSYSPANYKKQSSKVTGGANFVILRPEFLKCGQQFYQIRPKIKRVLLTLGGSDYRQLAPQLLSWLQQTEFEVVFIAASKEYSQKILRTFPNIEVFGYLNPNKMIRVITSVDVVISAAGQTLNELAYLGVPTIGICIDHDQVPNLNAFYQSEFLQEKIFWNDVDLYEKLTVQINSLTSLVKRKEVSQSGKRIVQGIGAEQIVSFFS